MTEMRSPLNCNSIPDDVALNIASLLEAPEVCNLGSCSKFWCDLCASDSLWLHLTRTRWPDLDLDSQASPLFQFQGWKHFYISKHQSLARCISVVIQFVDQFTNNESLEVGSYLKAVNDLRSMELGFKDVQLFLLARKHNVLLNLIGLHYSIRFLGISPNDVNQALRTCQIADRQVCVSWLKLGRWFHGFRLADEYRSRKVSLVDLVMPAGEEVLGVLNRGAVHEVFRVHITLVKPVASSERSQIVASAGSVNLLHA